MLDELPELARRLKAFVRENPLKERPWSEAEDDQRRGFAAMTGSLLGKAANACREVLGSPVLNDALSLAELRSYENRVNTVPLKNLPGSGVGLVRVLRFKMGVDNPMLRKSPGRIWAELEYSPLGWPELPDMAEADLNVLFEEVPQAEIFGPLINPKDLDHLMVESREIPNREELVRELSKECLRREWGFP
jgi:hypothetical protein